MAKEKRSAYNDLDDARASDWTDVPEGLTAEARQMVHELGYDGILALRATKKGKGHPTNAKILADEMNPHEWRAAMRSTVAQAALAKQFLTKSGLAKLYHMISWPLVLVFRLPAMKDKYANEFGEYAARWMEAYAPIGIPLFHHMLLLGHFIYGYYDCFERKTKGEPALLDTWRQAAADAEKKKAAQAAQATQQEPDKEPVKDAA